MSSSLLLQQCPACLVRLTCIVFVMGGKCPYSWCLVGCCRQNLFNTALNILVQFPSSFFSSRLVSVHVVHPYSSIDTTADIELNQWITINQYLSSSPSYRAISTDISDPLSPLLSSSIASGRSSGLQLVSAQSCCVQVLADRPAFARPCEGVHRSTSLISSSVLLRQCPACLVDLTLIIFVMGGKWPYSCSFVGCCLHDSFNIACSILVQLPSSIFSMQRLCSAPIQQYRHDRCSEKNAFYFIGQV